MLALTIAVSPRADRTPALLASRRRLGRLQAALPGSGGASSRTVRWPLQPRHPCPDPAQSRSPRRCPGQRLPRARSHPATPGSGSAGPTPRTNSLRLCGSSATRAVVTRPAPSSTARTGRSRRRARRRGDCGGGAKASASAACAAACAQRRRSMGMPISPVRVGFDYGAAGGASAAWSCSRAAALPRTHRAPAERRAR